MTLRLMNLRLLVAAAIALAVALGLLLPTGHKAQPADRSQIAVMELGRS